MWRSCRSRINESRFEFLYSAGKQAFFGEQHSADKYNGAGKLVKNSEAEVDIFEANVNNSIEVLPTKPK